MIVDLPRQLHPVYLPLVHGMVGLQPPAPPLEHMPAKPGQAGKINRAVTLGLGNWKPVILSLISDNPVSNHH